MVVNGEVHAIVSEKVLREVNGYFQRIQGRHYAFLIATLIRKNFEIVSRSDITKEVKKWRGSINEKDLEHLATVKHLKLSELVAYDRDYENHQEYTTPKRFLKKLKLEYSETEY
ncbi:MAG: hypothetical protein MSIBF_06350 [Candidatus Altiarchaeales archaeon IMC4]|nr:MAG: hypothetical protein MSIBF_06350 [Candidatus Altiarchaeales archaeon IMC4]